MAPSEFGGLLIGAVGIFKDITLQIKDKQKNKQISPVDWQVYASLSLLLLNPHLQQYGRFTPGRRVFGRAPKMPIAAVGGPNFCDFTNRNDPPATQTRQVLSNLMRIQRASLRSDFRGKFNLSLYRRVRDMERADSAYGKLNMSIGIMTKIKRVRNGNDLASL